jgi:hypothetical protein
MEKRIGFLTGLFLMIVLAIAMALVATIVSGGTLTIGGLAFMALCAFVINFVASLIIPANRIGAAFCQKLNIHTESLGHYFLTTFVNTFLYVTIISFGMTLINIGFTAILVPAWLGLYPILLIAGYAVALIAGPFALKLAKKLSGV